MYTPPSNFSKNKSQFSNLFSLNSVNTSSYLYQICFDFHHFLKRRQAHTNHSGQFFFFSITPFFITNTLQVLTRVMLFGLDTPYHNILTILFTSPFSLILFFHGSHFPSLLIFPWLEFSVDNTFSLFPFSFFFFFWLQTCLCVSFSPFFFLKKHSNASCESPTKAQKEEQSMMENGN